MFGKVLDSGVFKQNKLYHGTPGHRARTGRTPLAHDTAMVHLVGMAGGGNQMHKIIGLLNKRF
jgi:hypothetical protein